MGKDTALGRCARCLYPNRLPPFVQAAATFLAYRNCRAASFTLWLTLSLFTKKSALLYTINAALLTTVGVQRTHPFINRKWSNTMSDQALQQATYINLETFRKNGVGVKTPVWQTSEAGTIYVWTQAESWKVKRIRANPRVRLCASDARGNPLGDWHDGQARIVDGADAEAQQRKRMAAKYGLFFHLFRLMALFRRTTYAVIAINPT